MIATYDTTPAIGDTGSVDLPRTIQLNGAGHAEPPGARPPATERPLTNEPTFQDNADELIRVGRLITSFKRIGLAIRDRRCERSHLLVLYAIMEKLNEKTGTAFPSRRGIGEQEALGEKVVENAIYELRSWGYIDWERRAEPELHKSSLLHYTLPVLTWTEADLTRAILAHRKTLKTRSTPPTGYPACGGQRPRGTPPTGSESTPPTGTRNLLKEPAKTISGADAPVDATLFSDAAPSEGAPPPSKGSPCKPSKADIDEAFNLYLKTAERCGLAKPKSADPWVPNIKARLRESGGIDGWKEVLAKVEASPFLRGERTKFRADLDWLSGPKNFQKVLSGKYDEAISGQRSGRTFDDDLKEFAASQTGRDILARDGPEKGMERLRKIVADNRRRNGLDA